jgi:hypothetical protein
MARPFPPKTEFFIDSTWVDATSSVFGKSGEPGSVSIMHGMSEQQNNISPDSCTFTLRNADGKWSNRYPLSPYYGKIPRYTQVRQSVPGAGGDMDLYALHVEPDDSGLAFTTDKATLDVVGDIDIRIELTPAYGWRGPSPQQVAAKWTPGATSWSLRVLQTGRIEFATSQTGTTLGTTYFSTAIPITATQRLALRVTLDVDLGGTQKVMTFYTSDSITGTWTILGTAQTTAGTTSIASTSSQVEVGSGNDGGSVFAGGTSYVGKVHGFEMYSGIAGTKVADYKPNRTGNVVGSTTWADTCATPNTWSVVTKTRITSDRIRFVGEMANLPLTWDTTKRDVALSVQAYTAFRRLSKGGQPLHSPIYRNLISQVGTNLYFPMEDGSDTLAPQAVVGSGPYVHYSSINFSGSTPDGFPGSAGAVTLAGANAYLQVSTAGRTGTGTARAVFYFKLTAVPTPSAAWPLFEIRGQGTIGSVVWAVANDGYAIDLQSAGGTSLASGTTLFGAGASPLNSWVGVEIELVQSGPNINWSVLWHGVTTEVFYIMSGSIAGSVGRFNWMRGDVSTNAAFANMQSAHWLCTTGSLDLTALAQAENAFLDEMAGDRIRRLGAEENMQVNVYGQINNVINSAPMGYQRIASVLDLFTDCAKVDGGVFGEARDRLGFVYYCASFLGNRRGLVLSESSSHLSAQPIVPDDDRYLINDYTATRTGGGSARTVAADGTYGPNNILDPPAGVGRVPGGDTFNAATDDQVQGISQYQVFWRTWDESRIPNLSVGLHRSALTSNQALTRQVLDAYLASPVKLQDLLTIASFDALNMSIIGYTETYDGFLWTIIFNTIPQGPNNIPRAEIEGPDDRIPRAGDSNSVLNADITSTANTFVINTLIGAKWIVGSSAPDFPIYVMMGGELMSVGQIGAPAGALQTASNVTRSVNGVVKAQTASTPVEVRDAVNLGLV